MRRKRASTNELRPGRSGPMFAPSDAMQGGVRIGRILGIDLVIDSSWAFIFLLMTWNVTIAFLEWHPTWGFVASVALATLTALLFFASVLAHELAHALIAVSLGMRVTNIRLFLFGGVSNLEREPTSARAEALMAIVGPALSIGIGLNLIAIATRLIPSFDPRDPVATFAQVGPLATLLLWLGPTNLMLGIFNLVPAFPLDGGRVLRALLWRATNDLSKATLWASTIGQVIGWAFVLVGIAKFFGAFGGGAIGGLWLAFIGWFLATAAARSYASLRIQEALAGLPVAQLMRRSGTVVPQSATVKMLVEEWFLRSGDHAFPVLDDDHRFVGLVSSGDVRRSPREAWSLTTVAEIMTPLDRLVVVAPSEEVISALHKLAQIDVEQLPVLDDGSSLVGILERRHIARWLELRLTQRLQPSHATHAT